MTETHNGFRDEFFFLSNFFEAPVTVQFQGMDFVFQTGEHVFQGMKVGAALNPARNVAALRALELAPTPGKAKYWGRSLPIDIKKWDSIAETCMRRTIQLKFEQNLQLAELLLGTGDMILVEYNDWNDRIWGKDSVSRQGENRLGQMLMSYRQHLIKNQTQN